MIALFSPATSRATVPRSSSSEPRSESRADRPTEVTLPKPSFLIPFGLKLKAGDTSPASSKKVSVRDISRVVQF